jgi:Zn-dependent peptidase ImmA (M78 family)
LTMKKPANERVEKMAMDTLNRCTAHTVPVPVEFIAQQLGLKCKLADLQSGVAALLVFEPGTGSIAISRALSPEKQRFAIAHEIGHYLLHTRDTREARLFIYRGVRLDAVPMSPLGLEEKEANCFAAALLMPRDLLADRISEVDMLSNECVQRLATVFCVSVIAMTCRLVTLGMLSAVQD